MGAKNSTTAIDLEIAPDTASFAEFLRVYRENGLLRLIKSLGRHTLGIDRALAKTLQNAFGGTPSGQFVQGDASATDFEPNSFDFIMSTSVFEHLPDPAAVAREIERILKPGGTVLTITHVYTSISGAHDPRVFSDMEALSPWAHLNPQEQATVQSNSYLNQHRIRTYIDMFDSIWPGNQSRLEGGSRDRKRELLRQLPDDVRASYSEDELLTDVIITLWEKPAKE